MAAAALHIDKPEQPQLAKHDSTILGRIDLHESRKKNIFMMDYLRFGFRNGLHWFDGSLH